MFKQVNLEMITLILHHTAIELVNKEACDLNHKAIKNDAKRRNKKAEDLILDISVHQSAIYPDQLRYTGRPDLAHYFLLQYHHMMKILPDNIVKNIRLYVHTRKDEMFLVPQSWRVPVHFIRFRGLLESLLINQEIIYNESEAIRIEKQSLEELIENIKPLKIINLIDTGLDKPKELKQLLQKIETPDQVIVLIGGYQKGEIEITKIKDYPIEAIKLLDQPTTAWLALTILFSELLTKIKE